MSPEIVERLILIAVQFGSEIAISISRAIHGGEVHTVRRLAEEVGLPDEHTIALETEAVIHEQRRLAKAE
jgi:hypothetical protein